MGQIFDRIRTNQNNNLHMQIQYEPEFVNFRHSISVLTYNVLAACYCDKTTFRYASQENLYFVLRAKKIVDQLEKFDADIICLQELDHFQFYQKFFTQLNYEVFYTQRPNREDGCAILFKSEKFTLLGSTPYSLDKLAINYGLTISYQRQNVFQIVKLEHKYQYLYENSRSTKKQIIVGNIHSFWNPNQDDLKYFQLVSLVKKMELEKQSDDQILVICGDLNSLPNSNQIQYLLNKEPVVERIEKQSTTQIKLEKEINDYFQAPSLNWQSAYNPFPKFTNYTKDFKGCIDYIFYHNASVGKILKMPEEYYLSQEIALPNAIFPSDHLPLLAYFDFY